MSQLYSTLVHLFLQPSRDSSVSRCSTGDRCWVAGVRHACNYIYPACNSTSLEQLRTSRLHHRCLGAACSPAAPPVLQSQCTYCISLKLEPSPELPLYIFLRVSCTAHPLLHHYCTTAQSRAHLVHLSCTSNHCRRTSRSLAIGTSYSCTSRALLNLVHYSISCTTQSRALLNLVNYSISCTTQARALLNLVHYSISCTSNH